LFQSLVSRLRNPSKHAGAAYQEARPIHVRMDLRSTAPAERGREAAGEACPRREAWPVAAAPRSRLRLPAQRIARKKNEPAKESGKPGRQRRKGEEGGWGASEYDRARAGRLRSYQDEMAPLFFVGQVISARRGGAAADAVVGAGGPIGRQNSPGSGGSRAASGARAE
jgi:hypothetical protein